MSDLKERNFFKDRDIQDDPYAYFDALREAAPIWQEPHFGVFMVSGYDEARAVYGNPETFSSCNNVAGPFQRFPVPFEGDDVSDIIETYRDQLAFSDQLPTFDPPKHAGHRGLMMRLLTPRRMRKNEEFMWRLADLQLGEFLGAGGEFIHGFAEPFTASVIADLEGVPEADHGLFREHFGAPSGETQHKPLAFLYDRFAAYIAERRETPRGDIMTEMANAKYPDGSTPDVKDVALLAANLFAGGQETTVRLLSFALRIIGDDPGLQAFLRADRERIPGFIEETLRYESPLRSQFRMARRRTTVAGVEIAAGGTLLLLPGGANRDPRAFANPNTFDPERQDARNHLTFGHGIHHCAGAHLARAEGKVAINRLLDLTSDIRIAADVHGPAGSRHYDYLPTFFLRGLLNLTVEFDRA
ncbi:MAG TPA: cytochrome P450 [Frankiaceae bacterium]|nr:cytochrome P450 [Frankiaceae bacterium]